MKFWKISVVAAGAGLILAGCGGGGGGTASSNNSGGGCTSPKGAAASGTTAAQTVQVVSDPNTVGAFKPQTVNAKAGDTVEWDFTDSSSPHTVTADNGSFDSCTQNAGFKFAVTFGTAGDFKYHCTLHSGMIGDVKVS